MSSGKLVKSSLLTLTTLFSCILIQNRFYLPDYLEISFFDVASCPSDNFYNFHNRYTSLQCISLEKLLLNPKFEYRNGSTGSPSWAKAKDKSEFQMTKTQKMFWTFEFWYCLGFRISCFGFRVIPIREKWYDFLKLLLGHHTSWINNIEGINWPIN